MHLMMKIRSLKIEAENAKGLEKTSLVSIWIT